MTWGPHILAASVSVFSCARGLCSEMAAQAALETQKARSVRSAQQRGDFEAMQLAINEGGSSAAGGGAEVILQSVRTIVFRHSTPAFSEALL